MMITSTSSHCQLIDGAGTVISAWRFNNGPVGGNWISIESSATVDNLTDVEGHYDVPKQFIN